MSSRMAWSSGTRLSLVFERPPKEGGFRGLSSKLVPVPWGERHYLIARDELIDFVNDVNAGFEPCSSCIRFLLKSGDEKKSVHGQPDVPAELRRYLLAEPIDARVLSLGKMQIEQSWRSKRVTRLIVNKGTADGLLTGMKLHVAHPENLFITAVVVHADDQSSEVEVEQFDLEDAMPSIGWELSTRAARPR